MTKVIADILNANQVSFSHLINDWESRTGHQKHDIRLYSDMRTRAVAAIRDLGLDPTDTIPAELYFALQERARQDNLWLMAKLKIKETDSPSEMLAKIIKWVEKNAKHNTTWALKPSYVKAVLKKQVPKNVMKKAGLRSADSMLRRIDASELLVMSQEFESEDWRAKLHTKFAKVTTADFADTKIKLSAMPSDRTKKMHKAGFSESSVVLPSFETGSIVLLSPAHRFPLDVLVIVVAISEAIGDIRRHGAFYRLLSVRKDFGKHFASICMLGIERASLRYSKIGWNSFHRHLVGNDFFADKLDQPHVTREDLVAESSVDFLHRIDPRFGYWKDLEFTFYSHTAHAPVSLNLVDIVFNAANRIPYSKARNGFGRRKLWEELWARYLQSDRVAEEVIDSYLST